MPIYEYACSGCGNVTEVRQGFSDPPLDKCQQCSGQLQRLISQTAFHLKGSGWYVTDYSKKASSGACGAASACETKCETKKTSECTSCKSDSD